MGVNMAGNCIFDDEACREASKQEIVRRYYQALVDRRTGNGKDEIVYKIELLMKKAGIDTSIRKCVAASLELAERTEQPAAAIELNDGRIVTGKTSALLGASSAALLNALKALGGIDDKLQLIAPTIIEPIQDLKINHLGNNNPRLHMDEVLIALSICAVSDPTAKLALDQLEKLKGCNAHTTVILSQVDNSTYKKLGIHLTCEPKYQTKKLFHK